MCGHRGKMAVYTPRRGLRRNEPYPTWISDSSLQDWETINFHCSPPVCGFVTATALPDTPSDMVLSPA